MISRIEAVVLKTIPFRETSIIATLCTREYGKMSVVAKGARGPKGKMSAALQPMNLVTAVVYRNEQRDLHLVSECDILRPLKNMTSDLDKMGAGLAVVELTSAATHGSEEHAGLYSLVCAALETIDGATKRPQNALYFFEHRLLTLLGFAPDLHRCPRCGLDLSGAPDHRRTFLDTGSGVLCGDCSAVGVGLAQVSIQALRVLQFLQDTKDIRGVSNLEMSTAVESEVAAALRRSLQRHVEGLGRLKSEDVFAAIRNS